MTHALANPEQSSRAEAELFSAWHDLQSAAAYSTLSTGEVEDIARAYGKAFAIVQLLRVAEQFEREGSYSLGRKVRERIESIG